MSLNLHALKSRATPPFGPVNAKKEGYRNNTPIDHDGAAASEPCVDMRDLGVAGVNHYATPYNPPYHQAVPGAVEALWLRRGVADKLLAVNEALRPHGVEIQLFDAWRPQAIQRYFHDTWFPDWLRRNRPDLSDGERFEEVERYWAAPSEGKDSPSPHSTGGAVDLTLQYVTTGQPLFMGGLFDDLTENAHTDWFERGAIVSMSDKEAQANRRLLYWTMDEAGFANNPTEWWHYSYGDQMWARLRDEKAALYPAWSPEPALSAVKG